MCIRDGLWGRSRCFPCLS